MEEPKNTLYITCPDASLPLDGENVAAGTEADAPGRVPFPSPANIVRFCYCGGIHERLRRRVQECAFLGATVESEPLFRPRNRHSIQFDGARRDTAVGKFKAGAADGLSAAWTNLRAGDASLNAFRQVCASEKER